MISEKSIKLFHKVATAVPAYKNLLQEKNCNPADIKTVGDFLSVPIISKKSYLQPAKREDLLWPNAVYKPLWVCSTSGSTGEPYYFVRDDDIAARGAEFIEQFLKSSSYGYEKSRTLVLVAFGMGVWIGGTITLRSFEIALRNTKAPVSLLPTGYNKAEVFKALKKLAPEYDQTIFIGYPPFVKEVVDEASSEGIDLAKLNMRLMFAAEAFTETFRNYVCEKAGVSNPISDTLNIYGSADLGAMAHETPLSILIRRLSREDPLLYKDIFGQIEKTPTLAQYNPDFIEFEEVDGELLITSDGALPLVRYAIGDHGGVRTFEQIDSIFNHYGISLVEEMKKAGISNRLSHRPFVFVYERTDLSASLHGIIIYPEFVKEALLKPSLVKFFTERFTMATKQDVHHNQFLQINLELQDGVKASEELKEKVLRTIKKSLIERSSEFSEVSKTKDSDKLLQVILWDNGHPRYFAPGTKQKWVEKA